MDNKIKNYVNDVLSFITTDKKNKNRIEKDLYSHIYEASQSEDLDWVLNNMGNPKDVAIEFMDNINDDNNNSSNKHNFYITNNHYNCWKYEYKSKITLFGLPLIHINFNNYPGKPEKAKGIIALGNFATGILAIGGGSLGIISIGGCSIGLISFGGISIGGLSFGGLSIGILALGGLAIGIEAMGGCAVGLNVAMGGAAFGETAIGPYSKGNNVLQTKGNDLYELKNFLENVNPGKESIILKILNLFT